MPNDESSINHTIGNFRELASISKLGEYAFKGTITGRGAFCKKIREEWATCPLCRPAFTFMSKFTMI